MYTRLISPPEQAFFLFGPRGTGKSTWLKRRYHDALRIDLLPPEEALRFGKDPGVLTDLVRAESPDRWVVIDEIQKVPTLLDQVHHLMENYRYKKFILSGSSARKLRAGSANLLAGRAVTRKLFPFTSAEVDYELNVESLLQHGMLPLSFLGRDGSQKEDFLRSYLTTYLSEEIKAEGLVRNYVTFSRFLEVAALSAGTAPNMSGLARDAGIGRDTVQGYFSVFVDTLLGNWLPAYRSKTKVREVASPKFYWFDSGVLHAAASGFDQPMPAEWRGILLEHLVFHEISAYREYHSLRGKLGYWAKPRGPEVDFVFWYGDDIVAIEVKASQSFRKDQLKGLRAFEQQVAPCKKILVYLGTDVLQHDDILVFPYLEFCRRLNGGEILASS